MSEQNRNMITRESLKAFFERVDQHLETEMSALLIGGGAMSLKGDKDATKDVDVVVVDRTVREKLASILRELGFQVPTAVPEPYKTMNARVFQHRDGPRLDLFPATIGKRFHVHEGVLERAEHYLQLPRLKVSLLADEDIFLSKAVTERDLDLDDMYVLYLKGLEENIIIRELESQKAFTDTAWASFLNLKLGEMEERFDITIPWRKKVERLALEELEEESKR